MPEDNQNETTNTDLSSSTGYFRERPLIFRQWGSRKYPGWLDRYENTVMMYLINYPDSKVHGANMGSTWVLSSPDGPHVGPMNRAIRVGTWLCCVLVGYGCIKPIYVIPSPVPFKITSLVSEVGLSYDCPNSDKVILKDMDKIIQN